MVELVPYERIKTISGRKHLLIGNGHSIACDRRFQYPSLYEKAKQAGLPPRAQATFEYLGTNNFEGVLRLLLDGEWLGRNYGYIREGDTALADDMDLIKRVLVDTVAQCHFDDHTDVGAAKLEAGRSFLKPYHNVFSTNYDLLAYWANMRPDLEDPNPIWQDGFGEDEPNQDTVMFVRPLGELRGMFFLHGGLHLFVNERGEVRKHCWSRTGVKLTSLIRRGIENKQFPLFVAEGTADKKTEQIRRNAYLAYCYDKFGRIENTLVIYGLSFGGSDEHIRKAITENKKLRTLCVGLFDSPDSEGNMQIRAAISAMNRRRTERGYDEFDVRYFNSKEAAPWEAPATAAASASRFAGLRGARLPRR